MRTKKAQNTTSRLSGEQIVQKKLDEINELLRKIDLSTIPTRPKAKAE